MLDYDVFKSLLRTSIRKNNRLSKLFDEGLPPAFELSCVLMGDWIQVKGNVKKGYGVASGISGDLRFPRGTLKLQKPFFQERGLNLDGYYLGTINLSIAPHRYEVKVPKCTFRQVEWSPENPAEDFSFFDCRILTNSNHRLNGLIYYPHPETKPEHFQSPDVLEIITFPIDGLNDRDKLIMEVDREQMAIY